MKEQKRNEQNGYQKEGLIASECERVVSVGRWNGKQNVVENDFDLHQFCWT